MQCLCADKPISAHGKTFNFVETFPWKFFHYPLPNSFIWLGARAKRDASWEGRVSQKENFEHNRSKQLFGGIRKSYEEDYTEKEEEKEEKTNTISVYRKSISLWLIDMPMTSSESFIIHFYNLCFSESLILT